MIDSKKLYDLFKDHYWDSFERDKETVLKHVRSVMKMAGYEIEEEKEVLRCDACQRIVDKKKNLNEFKYYVHIENIILGETNSHYTDNELNIVSGRFVTKKVCNKCYNRIMGEAFKVYRTIYLSTISYCNGCDYFGTDSGIDGHWYTCWHKDIDGTNTIGSVSPEELVERPDWCPLRKKENMK